MTTITFLQPSLSLIHIPLHVYPHFVHAILSLLREPPEFLNLSFTPTSLSLICPQHIAKLLFTPIITNLKDVGATIEEGGYLCMQIDGEGICDGTRLLELTQPLARAGVSILFITTYFSDYVLVAAKEINKVRKVLLGRDFIFEDLSQSYISTSRNASPMLPSPAASPGRMDEEVDFMFDEDTEMKTSVESLAAERQLTTLDFLRQCQVPVSLMTRTKVIMTGSRNALQDYTATMIDLLLARELPKFFSLTLAPESAPSFLLSQEQLSLFDTSALLGVDSGSWLVPITLDLRGLSGVGGLGGCGIICGVVDELMQRANKDRGQEELVMTYLSTVVTGNVLIREEDVNRIGTDGSCHIM